MSGVDLDEEVRRVDPDRWFASRFIADPSARADVIALYAFDHHLARVETAASSPLGAQIRLTWWREAIEEIFAGGVIRRHPAVEALAKAIRTKSLPQAPFDALFESRLGSLEATPMDLAHALAWAQGAHGQLACLAAMSLGEPGGAENAVAAGTTWGLTRLRRSGRVSGHALDRQIRETLNEARRASRRLRATSFPAALPATLAGAELARGSPSDLEKRVRLAWAVLSGRL
ncbi:MAG TPA: squalene/phytoene synthase family protein [Caulobacteraceae bacterium]|nr:squalene/phytoene synthase family protein [Caulobacteraceae bacterium]